MDTVSENIYWAVGVALLPDIMSHTWTSVESLEIP